MSKINQIQEALKEVDGGKFQKICDAYLKACGFGAINALGSVIGKDKTKTGTPDTFARDKQGKLYFVEYTTQQSGIFDKFADDLGKCSDPGKTGVEVSDIHKVIFCHNSQMPPSEENGLVKMAADLGLKAEVLGLDAIGYALYVDFQWLARDFLGIQIDTDQILAPEAFVSAYDKNQLTTPLATDFYFRDNEVQQALEHLQSDNLVLLAGPAGVGKSRLALEILARYQDKADDAEPFCILSKGLNLFDDIKVYFSNRSHVIIFVDDANRTTNFQYLVDLLQHKKPDQIIKIVATVRDYALGKVEDTAKQLGIVPTLTISPLEIAQTQELVEKLYGINNPVWLERIGEVAGGNPRLAIMAAQVAMKDGNLNSINDVSAIYDHYFAGIRSDIEALDDENIVKVAGVVSFFRNVDRSNPELMNIISKSFNIDQTVFWSACQKLHKFELVDIYENQVVKISDQVIATYLFYLHFLKDDVTHFSELVDTFYPKQSARIRDAFYPCLNAFDAETIVQRIVPFVHQKVSQLEAAEDRQGALAFLKLFWFAAEAKILSLIKEEIDATSTEPANLDELDWEKPNTNVSKSHILETLKIFQNAKTQDFELAIHLICNLVEKQPSFTGDAIHALTEEFGFTRKSHIYGYVREARLIDILIERTDNGSNDLLSRLFLGVAKYFLHTSFREHTGSRRTITIHTFKLLATDAIKSLRQKIWNHCFSLLEQPESERAALEVFRHYASSGLDVDVKEIRETDAKLVVPLMLDNFSTEKFSHGLTVQMFLKAIRHLDIPHKEDLAQKFDTDVMQFFRVLNFDYLDMDDRKWSAFEEEKKARIADFTKDFTLTEYQWAFERFVEFVEEKNSTDLHTLNNGLQSVFLSLADRDVPLFEQVVLEALSGPQKLLEQIYAHVIVQKLFQTCSLERVREIIENAHGNAADEWRCAYHLALPEEMVTNEDLQDIKEFFETAEGRFLPHAWGQLQKYQKLDDDFFVCLTKTINERAKQDPGYGHRYGLLFNSVTELGKRLSEIFVDDVDVLKEAYLLHDKTDKHSDYNGAIMGQILDLDPTFLLTYYNALTEGKTYLSRYDDRRDYSFIWRRDNAADIVEQLIDLLSEKDDEYGYFEDYITTIFVTDEHKKVDADVIEAQDAFLERYIPSNALSPARMRILFNAIGEFETARRLKFVTLFLENNTDIELFKEIKLERNGYSWTGSAVPILTRTREYWKEVAAMCNSVALLSHRQYCGDQASVMERRILEEKKRDFMDD